MRKAGSSTRSHHGCQRCKAKRVKCDETTPGCLACQRAGAECSGYGPRIRWSRKHERWNRHTQPTQIEEASHVTPTPSSLAGEVEAAERPQQSDIPPSSSSMEIPLEVDQNGLEMPWMPYWDNQLMPEPDLGHWMNLPLTLHAAPMELFGYRELYPRFESNMIQYPDMTLSQGFEPNQMAGSSYTDTARSTSPAENNEVVQDGCLLETFYRLSVPTSIPRFSDEYLIRYYFDNICPLISCFDSHLNPFRALVGDMWPKSRTIYFAIQSMAIAHLTNHYPYMERLGLGKRSQAWKSLQLDLRRYRAGQVPLDELLMSLLLIGPSSVWYQRSNLGLQYLFMARNLMQAYLQNSRSQKAKHSPLKNQKFFHDALMHWEMSASFAEPVAMMPFPGYGMPVPHVQQEHGPKLPHPWTGLTTELDFAIAEVGRILRRRRSRSAINSMPRQELSDDPNVNADKQWAQSLEAFLWAYEIPTSDSVIDYEDVNTPVSDLLEASAALRYAGLLELYVAFPQIFERRAATMSDVTTLRDISVRMLEAVESISISSGACRLLPLVLLSSAGQLRLPHPSAELNENQNAGQDETIEARFVVEARCLALSRKFPKRQWLTILDQIVKETWQRLDDGHENAHWLDVAYENGWQTLVG